MRKIISVTMVLLAAMLAACGNGQQERVGEVQQVDTLPLMVMQIQKCSRLYTSEYQLHKIVTFDDTLSVGGKVFQQRFKVNLSLGKRRIAIPVKASVKAYVDFSEFSEANVRVHGDKVEIVLPDPEVTLTATQIDHEGVREKVSLFRSRFTDEEVTQIQRQGRDDIIKSIPRLGIIENARQNAARQLVPIVEALGYRPENITVTFRKRFTISDIPNLIKTVEP
ncbi:MAG: DUF4230 domain-containing protein [Hallella sp.]|uniref:DUF4230 domain-containing protein n=1 Tax=Hallella sp. TaxID=2980186 RepID=UPI002E792AE3|nr:DUF4230 domain-containing protein [Hallella sp.]MED9945978.1 DUF4230 domain-containing protein [Hallella sp.]